MCRRGRDDCFQICTRGRTDESSDGWQGRGHQDRGERGRRKDLWRRPTEACQTDSGRTLNRVLTVTPSGGKAGPRRMPAGCGADRNGPRLGNTGALPTAFRTGVR